MPSADARRARPWFGQAASDTRTAAALASQPSPMQAGDVGCHVAALCAQAVEKSIKGYVIVNGQSPRMSHRADKYLVPLLSGAPLLRFPHHHRHLSALFDSSTRAVVRRLIDLTPGTLDDKNAPNTEYPWLSQGVWRTPGGHELFSDAETLAQWTAVARRVTTRLSQLASAAERALF
jgi:hypothetical protein